MQSIIDTKELKEQAPLIPYIKKFYSDKIKIEKESNETAFARCIFHEEDTASLCFYENGTFKCFGCGASGDIITLVQSLEGCNFTMACKIIANNVGYNLTYDEPRDTRVVAEYKQHMTEIGRRYVSNLNNSPDVLDYLFNVRRIGPDVIRHFGIGLTDKEEYKYRTDINNISDCIVFPLFAPKDTFQVLGFGYKPLSDTNAKYINDRNQSGLDGQDPGLKDVFVKGNLLFGYPQAYKHILKQKCVFVVEGYFDVLSMYQAGIQNTVGIMGTSMTYSQMELLDNITNHVILMLDFDKAGINNSEKIINRFSNEFPDIQVSIIPADYLRTIAKDPDELCKYLNYSGVLQYLENHITDGITYLLDKTYKEYRKDALKMKLELKKKLCDTLKNICLIDKKAMYEDFVRDNFNL